jgi:transposase
MSNNYKQGLNRKQQLLLPPSLDEYVGENNSVRAIESYVEILDLNKLEFKNLSKKSNDGQPAFHPKLLLKIYIYGYLNKIRSSRNLEKEIKRNIELMWLTQGLTPSYKTIANFRKNNPQGLKKVFKEFVLLCKDVQLIEGKLIAIDGAFLRANASKNRLIMKKNALKDLELLDERIEKYLTLLDTTDKEDASSLDDITLPTKIEKLQEKKKKLEEDLALLEKLGKNQYNTTDPDASLMIKPAHNLMAYNSQIAVDDKYKFIVDSHVTTNGNDFEQFHNMSSRCKEILEVESLEVVADTGYYSGVEIKKCIDDNITPIVPHANKQKAQKDKGKFTRDRFIYDAMSDYYLCPNEQHIKRTVSSQIKNGKLLYNYRGASKLCKACPIREKCLPQKTPYKQIFRWEYEHITEEHAKKMQTEEAKAIIKKRGSIVEHPFGTIKRSLGWDHFLVRGKEKVSGENALIMFSYNFKRLLNLIGISLFQKLIIATNNGNIEAIREEIIQHIASYLQNWLYIFRIFVHYWFGCVKFMYISK